MGKKSKTDYSTSEAQSKAGQKEALDFLPLEGGPGKRLKKQDGEEEPITGTSSVVYIGRIPHGFYEEQMEGFFKQFGAIKRLRIARNKKTGKSKHYGFIQFETPEVAQIVADSMNNYLLFEHMLQVRLVPSHKVTKKMWKARLKLDPGKRRELKRKQHNKERTAEEHNKLIDRIIKMDVKRRRKIAAAGLDYEYPEIVGEIEPWAKKIRFDNEE